MKKNISESKPLSILIITFIYLLVSVGAVCIAVYTPVDNVFIKILIADVIATVLVFAAGLLFKNASVYDPYWSVAPVVIAIVLLMYYKNITASAVIALVALLVWGIRLTFNWALFFSNLEKQDWRYDMLKQRHKQLFPFVSFAGIHLMPTLIVYCAFLPAAEIFISGATSYLSFIGLAVCLLATALELIADMQMYAFRRRKERAPVINTGLWKYSRHPNYLGEILFWWGIYLIMLFAAPQKAYLIFGAVINTLLFIFISIPMAEKRLAKREGYAEYKQSTPVLIGFKKKTVE